MPVAQSNKAIQFHFPASIAISDRSRLKGFIQSIFKREKKALGSLNYVFCSDEYLLSINKAYLKHDFYTDIITFDLSSTKASIEGEIYISVDRVRENAKSFERPVREELHRVVFHGALHLCGYKDKSPKEAKLMREMEDYCLKAYFKSVSRGT